MKRLVLTGIALVLLVGPAAAQGIDMGGTPSIFQQPRPQIDMGGSPSMFQTPNVIVVQPQVPNWPQPYPYVYPNPYGYPNYPAPGVYLNPQGYPIVVPQPQYRR